MTSGDLSNHCRPSSIHCPNCRVYNLLAPLPFTPEFGVRFPVSAVWEKQIMFLPHPRVKVSIVGSLRDREVACSASDLQGSNFESCVWRTVSSQSSHHPQEVLLAQFRLYVHKGGLKPDSFHYQTPFFTINWEDFATWWTSRRTTTHVLHHLLLTEEHQAIMTMIWW